MFNLKKVIKNKSIRLGAVLLSLLSVSAIVGVLFSCSFLEDDDFFGQIENEVAVANADKMNVYLRYGSIKFGKTTPADASYMQIKNNVAFSVNCVTNSEYAFYRWKAFSVRNFDISKQHMSLVYTNDDDWLANYGAMELDASVVQFVNPAAESTIVYVTQTRDDIWIMPVVAVRPTIAGTFPDTSQNPVRNTKLRVQFSKPMDEASFAGNYIISQATRAADFSLNETDITDQFQMVINENKNLVTFSFREDAAMTMFNPGVVARLYFTDEIADSTGYTMAESKTLSWNIGSAIDTLPPLITEMTGGIDNDCSKFASTPTRLAATADANLDENALYTDELVSHRIRDKLNIYVYAQDITKADGERLESDVLMLGFRAKSITDLNGKALDSTAEGNFIADKIETYAAEENYSQITGSFRQITGKKAGCLYTYDLSSLPDGLIQVEVYAYDSTGNDGLNGYDPTVDDEDGVGNGPRSLFVIKDNAAPNIQTEVEKVKSSSVAAPFGWYNKVSVDSIEIYDDPSNPVSDYGHRKLGATHKGLKWVFHLGSELDWSVSKNDSSWLSLDEHYKVGAASVAQDGSVSISMRLMDDLGNMSDVAAISSVLYDNTPVVTDDISFVDSNGNRALNASSSTIVPDSSILKIPFTEELCGVKVIGINVKNSSGEAVPQPLASASVSYSEGGEASQATPVAIETDKSSLQAVFDSAGYATNPVFTDNIDNLNVLGSSYKTGILYIKNFALGASDGIYTVTATLYDSALNRSESKTITIAHDTTAPSVNRVIVQNVIPRTVYGESTSDYWLPRTAYDASGEPTLASIAVTATENGSGVNVLTLGGNAHLTDSSTISVGGTQIGSDKCSIDVASNKITFSDSYSPVIYSASGSISFVITNISFDTSNTAEGNSVSVSLKDFVGNVGTNANSGDNSKFDLYIDSTSSAPIFAIYTDKIAPAIAAGSVAIADGKQNSASDEVLYSSARLASKYTDQKKVELTLTLSPESSSYGSGVKAIQLTNGVFSTDTAISVNGTALDSSEYTLNGATATFKKVFTAADSLKFTNVELQGSDGSQQIAAVAKDLLEWASGEVASNAIILDRVAPIFGSLDWYVKEGVWGITKSALVDNLELIVPFTDVIGGVKCIRVTPKLGEAVEPSSALLSSGFAIAYSASEEINESVITGAANLVPGTDYDIVGENVIMLKNPQNYKSGLFILKNLKVSDNFEDGKNYNFAIHLTDAALNGTDTDATITITSDSKAPSLQRIYINRLIGRTLPITTTVPGANVIDSYWVTREGFTAIGTAPNRLDVEIKIAEEASGVEKITLGGDILLTADSAVYKGETLLAKGTDYEVNESNTEIKFKNKAYPLLKGSDTFVVKITNTTLTKEGENTVLITLADFALNSDATSSSSDIAPTATGSETAAKVYVDYTAPELCSAKTADRGGASEIASRPDVAAGQETSDGFTNENIVNIVLKTKYSALDSTRRSGVKKLVLGGGATYTAQSKFYYKVIDETDDAALNNADATSDGTGYTEITRVSASGDTAEFMDSYSCDKVCVFIITNIALSGTDGTKEVSAYPVDLAGWFNDGTRVTSSIILDTEAPIFGSLDWYVKEGVWGVTKSAVVDNLELILPFTDVLGGVKYIRVTPKLGEAVEPSSALLASGFAIAYSASEEINESVITGAANLVPGTDYDIVGENVIMLKNPQNYKSGLFILKNLKVSDNFEDGKNYSFAIHLTDAALNGTDTDATIALTSDSKAPSLQRIYINRLIGRTLPITTTAPGANSIDSYWVTREGFTAIGTAPNRLDVEIKIAEEASGVEKITLGGDILLTADSAVYKGETLLAKGTDYEVNESNTEIKFKNKAYPLLKGSESFVVKITNTTLTKEGENSVLITLADFALNSDATSSSSDITPTETGSETVAKVYVDYTAPELCSAKTADRGGASEIASRPDVAAEQEARDGFTNENSVNIVLKTKYSALDSTRRSGVKKLVLGGGATYTAQSKFYYKVIDETDDAALNNADAISDGTGYTEITRVSASGDTAEFMDSYSCDKVCVFIITNIALSGTDGTKEVSVYPVDLAGWFNDGTRVTSSITLDTTRPAWESNPVVMGSIAESANDAAYVYPKAMDAAGITGTTGTYFYKRPSEQNNLFLNVKATDTNIYSLHYVGDSDITDSSALVLAAKSYGRNFVEAFSDVPFNVADSHSYTIVLKDRAGNLSAETRTIHVVKDSKAEIVNDDASGSSLQNNMTYADSRTDYHIFKTSSHQALDYTATDGVEAFSGDGYAVYYNCDALVENPVTITVDITNHKEKNIALNSGVAYYAINGSSTAPTESLSETVTAPTTALQKWNKWIPFTSGASSLTLWPKNDGTSPLNMRLWFKDNVGNVQSIDIKNNPSQTEPDVWICDNDIPQNANGTTNGFVPENNQLSSASTGFAFEQIMPDHAWYDGSTLKFMNTSALKEGDEGKTENTIYYTDTAKLTLVINNEPITGVSESAPGTIIGNGTSRTLNWAVKIFLYPSASAAAPARADVMSWIEANSARAVTGTPSGSTITLSDIPYPTERGAAAPYIYVVAEDRVGNINISKLNVKVNAAEYVSSGTAPAAKDYWYGKFIYSGAATDTPNIYVGGTTSDVNDFTVSDSIRDIAKIVPYNAGRRAYTDGTTTWVSSKDDYDLPVSTLRGRNTKHDYSSSTNKRAFLYVDVDTEIPYAYYYSVSATSATSLPVSSIAGKFSTSNFYSNYSKWAILDGNGSGIDGLIPTVLGDTSSMTSNTTTDKTYLHVADKLGRVKTVKLGNTNWRHDNYPPNVDFTGLAANDKKNLYRLDYTGGKLAVTFANDAQTIVRNGGTVKVYIPTLPAPGTTGSYVSDIGSGLYGYSWLDHLENPLEETATEICRDDEDSDRGFYETIDTSYANGYYLIFNNETANATGSLSIADDSPQTFYVFDKVGNRTPVSITASVDDKPPELSMSFGAYSDEGFTEGRIYDASTTNTSNVINCNTTDHLSTQTFKGAHSDTTPKTDDIGYTVNKPYVIYSNASGTTGIGYVLGTFVAKDQKGTDTTGYSGILTEIVVKRYVLNGTDTGASADWEHISAITLPYALNPPAGSTQTKLEPDESSHAYTLPMPIFLDGEDDAHPVASGANFKGKLYQITIKDSGGNATTVYLKVMKDRTGPKFKCGDGYVDQDASHHAVVKGGVGYYEYYEGKVFYQSTGANQAYIELTKVEGKDGAAYDEDCGVVVTDRLLREYIYDSTLKNAYDAPVSGTAKYLLTGYGNYPYYYYLYAEDKLGNPSKVDLYVGSNKISSQLYYNDTVKPQITKTEWKSGDNIDYVHKETTETVHATNAELWYIKDTSRNTDGSLTNGKFKISTSSDKDSTGGTSAVRGYYISKTDLSSLSGTELLAIINGSDFITGNEIPIKPSEYFTGTHNSGTLIGEQFGKAYCYAVDYAGNFSNPYIISIDMSTVSPSISNVEVRDGVYDDVNKIQYFNKNTTIAFNLTPGKYNIKKYGLYVWDGTYYRDIVVANTEQTGLNISTATDKTTIELTNFSDTASYYTTYSVDGMKPYILAKDSFYEGYVYIPVGCEKWIYDASVIAPSNVSKISTESLVFTSPSEANKVWYSKDVDGRADKTFYVNVNFPADGAKISGYKIKIGGGDWSTTTQSFLETPSYSYSATTRKIPINVTSITDASDITTTGKTVSIKAVDGLGNESSAYEFTIKKIIYAPDVTGIKKDSEDEYEVSVDGTGATKFVKSDTVTATGAKIYVNGKADSITIKPVITDDVTGTAGFDISEDDGVTFTELTSSITDTDKSYTITFGTELPSTANGSKVYKIYARNRIDLHSERPYQLTVVRDVTGPVVSSVTLSALDESDSSASGKLNYIAGTGKLYYNNLQSLVSNVNRTDIIGTFAGVGGDDSGYFAVTTTTPDTAPDANAKLGNLDGKFSGEVYIAVKDKLGNVGYTKFSEINITIPAGSCISGSAVTINGTSASPETFTFVYDNTPPKNVTKVTPPDDTEGKGLHFDAETNTLYYNTTVLGSTSLELTPGRIDGALLDANHYGFKVGSEVTEGDRIAISPLSDGNITIYAVDRGGNDSAEGYELNLKAVAAPSITGLDFKTGSTTEHVEVDAGKVIEGSIGTTSGTIYVNNDVTTVTVTPLVSETITAVIEGFASSTTGTAAYNEGKFIITLEPSQTVYNIYVKNKLGMWSDGYPLTIVRDIDGPVVTEITLTAPAATDSTPAGKINYVDGKLYYNNALTTLSVGEGKVSDVKVGLPENVYFAITTSTDLTAFSSDTSTPTIGAGIDGENSNNVYIATVDKLGNIGYTPLSHVKITIPAVSTLTGTADAKIDGTATTPVEFIFAYDATPPAAPSSITLSDDAEALLGSGIYYKVTDADKREATLYYSTKVLDSTVTSIVVTPSPAPASENDLAGYYVTQDGSEFANLTPAGTVTVMINEKTARIYAVDKAGNKSSGNEHSSSQRYKITLTKDETGPTITQVSETGNMVSVYDKYNNESGDWATNSYRTGLTLGVKAEDTVGIIAKYAFTYGVTGYDNHDSNKEGSSSTTIGENPTEYTPLDAEPAAADWKSISSLSESGEFSFELPEIKSLHTHCYLWVKDNVGNATRYKLGLHDNTNQSWWILYDKPTLLTITKESANKKLTLKGFTSSFPVKSLEISGFKPSKSSMTVSSVKAYLTDSISYEITPSTTIADADSDGSYTCTLEFTKSYIMKDLELNFDSDGFYFLDGAKVKVTSAFDDYLESNLTASPKPTYTLSDKTLTITGLWSAYSMKYFSFKHKTEANSGISFGTGEINTMKSVNLYKDGAETTIISSSTPPLTNDNKYIITIDSGDGKCADSIVIEFDAVPTIAPGTQIEYAQGGTDGILVDLTAYTGSTSLYGGSLFGSFFDRVSSGVSSVFGGGRSMSHEELMAQKEAKAAKARARAAEKAAKKAAKKAKKTSGSAAPVESETWGGLSSSFESSSSALDSTIAQLKSSEKAAVKTASRSARKAQKEKKVRVVSKNSSAIEVAALASEAASEPEISSNNIEETEQGGSKLLLVIGGILASLGAAGGIFLKKSRKS